MSMNLVPGSIRLTADGSVGTSGKPIRVFSIHLVSGGTASTTVFNNGTASGDTPYFQMDGTANLGLTAGFNGGLRFPDGCFMNTDNNISYATIIYTEEF